MLRTRGAIREHYTRLEAGVDLWHVYPRTFAGDEFNSHSKGRFSAFAANPPRAMYYAASTPECAIWEVVLRMIVPRGPIVSIDETLYSNLQLAHLRLSRALPMLDCARRTFVISAPTPSNGASGNGWPWLPKLSTR